MKFEEYDKLLEEFSPGALDFLYGTCNFYGSAVYATLFKLEKKNIINILLDRIEVIDKEPKGLSESEQYIYNLIKNGKVVVNNLAELEKKFEEDAKKRYLYYDDKTTEKINFKFTLFFIIVTTMMLVAPTMFHGYVIAQIMLYICSVFFVVGMFKIWPGALEGETLTAIRTQVGRKVFKILKKLRNKLRIVKEEEKENWENYRVYSMILGLDELKTINDEYGHLIEFEKSKPIKKEPPEMKNKIKKEVL